MRTTLAPLLVSGFILGSIAFGGQPTGPAPSQQGEQGQPGQQQVLPKDMPKMIVIKAHQDKNGQDEDATVYTVDKLVKVNDQNAAQELNKDLETQQGVPLTECDMSTAPQTLQTLFQTTDRGDSKAVSWNPRWHFFNRGIYGYGARPHYGYRYPNYYGNYGYYWNGVTYPYTYYNYYYPYGGYNYYYYYNPYYRWW